MQTGHNSFDLNQVGTSWTAQSHNYPDICGQGSTPAEAINDLGMKAKYHWDNHPVEAKKELETRLKAGLQCRCGEPLPGDAVAYHTGSMIRPLFGPRKVINGND